MKSNFKILAMLYAIALGTLTMSCTKLGDDNDDDEKEEIEMSGNVEGVWKAGSVVNITGHITVPEGSSLTIEEGVEVIFSDKGVGVNHAPIEFTVKGNLYCKGTEEKPVLLSVAKELRTEANIFKGLWGGIVATETCQELLFEHTVIEYTGGAVIEGSPAAEANIYEAGDDAYPQITTNNINGKYVITNCIIRNGWSDGIYLMGGNAIIANNIFIANGFDGGEAVNVKAGCKVDVAGNIMFSPNTNGLKLSSSGQSETRGQAKIQAYNNTIINAGWRRDGEKGGCIYVEKNALANVFNNLMVNCKFKAMTPNFTDPCNPEEGYDNSSVIDYNYYASGNQESDIVFNDESGVKYSWEGYGYAHEDYNTEVVDKASIVATEKDGKDPEFLNFDINGTALTDYIFDDSWDFGLSENSPALSGTADASAAWAKPLFGTEGLTVNGSNYKSPAVASYFGAKGK